MTTTAITALERAAASNDIDTIKIEIAAALRSLKQQPLQIDGMAVHIRLRNAAIVAGSEAALARKIGITRQSLSDVMLSKREPGPTILAFLGLRKISPGRTMYTPDDEPPMPRRPRSERRQRAWDGPGIGVGL